MNREIDYERLIPGIYLHARSGLLNIWYMKVDAGEDYELTDKIKDTVVRTMYDYLSTRYGKYRILGVFHSVTRHQGIYIVTRFISNHMIFGATIDYIMELQCTVLCNIVGGDKNESRNVYDLTGAKEYMIFYYENHLKYQSSAMKYKRRRLT